MNWENLEKLSQLKEKGALSEKEFEQAKQEILNQSLPNKTGVGTIILRLLIFVVFLGFIVSMVNGYNRAWQRYENASSSSVSESLSSEMTDNEHIFKNVASQEFQELLEEGISEYLVSFFADGRNSPYSGDVYDYIFESPIPLPSEKVDFIQEGVVFTYRTGEISANYLGRIQFFVSYDKIRPFIRSFE